MYSSIAFYIITLVILYGGFFIEPFSGGSTLNSEVLSRIQYLHWYVTILSLLVTEIIYTSKKTDDKLNKMEVLIDDEKKKEELDDEMKKLKEDLKIYARVTLMDEVESELRRSMEIEMDELRKGLKRHVDNKIETEKVALKRISEGLVMYNLETRLSLQRDSVVS